MAKDTNFYPLRVGKRVQETDEAVTLYFEIPDDLKETFKYQAGQYLTLKCDINGTEQRRSYSMSTSPAAPMPGVTVKRVKNGLVSTYLTEDIKEGDRLEIMPPDGRFTITPDPERRRTYYFFGAGSGITPLMSQIRCLLEEEPMSTLHLFYGNRSFDAIIFREQLDALIEQYDGQLTVDHILSKPGKTGLIGSVFGRKKEKTWTGQTGRISEQGINRFLANYTDHNKDAMYLVCGPGNMIEHVRDVLIASGVDKGDIHAEYFTPADSATDKTLSPAAAGAHEMEVTLNGETLSMAINEKTILETLQDAGYDPPFSCTSGACATCMAKVLEGSAEMEMCFALSEDEVADGFILTCQSHPTSPLIRITYDV